jgi:hypothetical protein
MGLDAVERSQGQAAVYQRLLVAGRQGHARVKGLRETGRLAGGDPELELELDVEFEGARYPVVHCQVVSRLAVPDLRLGTSLPVRIDPDNPTTLTIA